MTERFARKVIQHRLSIVLLTILITLVAIPSASQVGFDSDIEIWFLENDPGLIAYHDFLDRFEGDEIVVMALVADDVFRPDVLRELDRLTRESAKAPFIQRARSLTNVKVPVVVDDDMRVDRLVPALPTTESEALAVRNKAMASSIVKGLLVSEKGDAAALVLEFSGKDNTFENKVETVRALDGIVSQGDVEGVRVIMAGSPVFDRAFYEYSVADMSTMGPVALLLVLLSTFLLFRRWIATVFPIGVVLITAIWVHGMMGALGLQLNLLSTSLLTLIIGVGVADSVHILSDFYGRIRKGGSKEDAARESTAHLLVPCFFTSTTTGIGFLTLLMGDLKPISEFGMLAAVSVVLAFVLSVTFLPAVLVYAPCPSPEDLAKDENAGIGKVLLKLASLGGGWRKAVLVTSLVVLVSAGWATTQIRTESNPVNYFKKNDPVRTQMMEMDERFGGSTNLELEFRTEPGGLKDPDTLRRISGARTKLEELPGFNRSFSFLEPLEEAHRVFADGEGIPESREMIAQLFLVLEGEREDFDAVLQGDYEIGRMSVRAEMGSEVHLKKRRDQMEAILDAHVRSDDLQVETTGFIKLMTDMEEYLFEGQVKSFLTALAVISVMMFFLLGSFSLGWLAMIPNLTPIAFGIAFMALADINLDPGTVMIGPIALGLVVDDTVHFLYRFRALQREGATIEEALRGTILSSGKAIVTTSLILSAGFGVLALGSFIPNIFFGIVAAVIVLVAMLADVVVLPAVLSIFRPGEGARG